nr:MAG TPA: Exonuclease [Caudoviricetes sp.]
MQAVTIDRDKYIGGSDIPIIMGISPFKTRFDLLLEKAGLKENNFEGNAYTEYGNILEPKIREHLNLTAGTGFEFKEYKKVNGDIRCHLDGYNEHEVLEIKTTSQIHENVGDYKVYLVQLLFYMENVECKNGLLAVYERPEDFSEEFDSKRLKLYSIELSNYKDLLEQINKAVDQFRIDLVKVKENPFITEEELLPVDLTELSNKVVTLENQLTEMKKVELQVKELKTQLKVAMEKNNIKKWETPNGVKITLVADGEDKIVKKFNEQLFKENNLDLWDEYSEDIVQKGKTGYVKITLPKEV